jgi:23S rRNA pseudouridine2605 synthase
MSERLQRRLARAGVASRRHAEDLIRAGRVTVNGRPAVLGMVVGPADTVEVDGRVLPEAPGPVYLALHKPAGYTTSLRDPHAAHVVTELIPARWGRVFPVGRLDRDTTGLLILTNDGELAHRLMHPRYGVPKVYEAWVKGVPGPVHLERLNRGVRLDDGWARPEACELVRTAGGESLIRLTLAEGRKREVRRLFQAVGHPVVALKRVQYGPIRLDGLAPGQARPLTPREIEALKRLVEAPGGRPKTRASIPLAGRSRTAPRAPRETRPKSVTRISGEEITRRGERTTAGAHVARRGRVGASQPGTILGDPGRHRRRPDR